MNCHLWKTAISFRIKFRTYWFYGWNVLKPLGIHLSKIRNKSNRQVNLKQIDSRKFYHEKNNNKRLPWRKTFWHNNTSSILILLWILKRFESVPILVSVTRNVNIYKIKLDDVEKPGWSPQVFGTIQFTFVKIYMEWNGLRKPFETSQNLILMHKLIRIRNVFYSRFIVSNYASLWTVSYWKLNGLNYCTQGHFCCQRIHGNKISSDLCC